MADDILNVQIGTATAPVLASLTIDNTAGTVSATASVLSGLVQVPITVNTATLSAGGVVNIAGTTLAGGTVGIAFTEGLPTATITTNLAGIVTTTTEAAVVACYLRGTHIRVFRNDAEMDVTVETLVIGDLAVTASGARRAIRWLGTRSYAGRFADANPHLLPICFKADAFAAGVPARDLWVSPAHAMFLDGMLIPAAALVNGVSVVKADRLDAIEYWHVELDAHDVLLAENAPSESYIDDSNRAMFHNAATYLTLYPTTELIEPAYCAPRVEDGHRIVAIRRRIDERAGLTVVSAPLFGDLCGHVDHCDGLTVSGWARDMMYPDAPVCLDIVVDGAVVALVYADRYRVDLERAGLGGGAHAFEADLPPALIGRARCVEIRRSADGCILGDGPVLVSALAARAA